MRKKFRPGELEKDFFVLFGKKSHWNWPFWDGDLFSSALNACFAGFIASLFFSLFGIDKLLGFTMPFWGYIIIALVYCVVVDNYVFFASWNQRRRLHRKYVPVVEHTDAYALLLDALDSQRKGVVEGLQNKKESSEYLLKLWKAAFAEANQLQTPLKSLESGRYALDDRPIGEQIKSYFDERQEAINELNS